MDKHLTNEFKYINLTSYDGQVGAPLIAVFRSKAGEVLLTKDMLNTLAEKRNGLGELALIAQVEIALSEFPQAYPEA